MPRDWSGDANSIFKQLGATSHSERERESRDYYATDPKAMTDLLEREKFSHYIWEPACGEGHLVKPLRERGFQVWASDIIDRGINDEILDFLTFDSKVKWPGDIITNPPYKFCTEFVLKALDCVFQGHKVAMFLKLQTLEGQERYNKLFKEQPPKTIYVYVRRIQCAKNGVFEGSSAVCYAWFVWEKGFKGDPSIKWIY